jgi:hypothetical protein
MNKKICDLKLKINEKNNIIEELDSKNISILKN